MKLAQLQSFFPKERHRDVEALYRRFIQSNPDQAEDIEGFISHLHGQGIVSTDTLSEVLAFHEVALTTLAAVGDDVPRSRYRLLAMLGKGAMGEIHLGRDPNLSRTVAIKRIDPKLQQKPAMLQRFFAEAQITAQLDHPNIVPIYGLEQDDGGSLTYAMKFVRGITLNDYMKEARESLAKGEALDEDHTLKARIERFLPVLNAIDYAHRRNILHRDLKPENIMVGAFGEVLVMDWGIARPIGKRERVTTTHSGNVEKTRADALVGTPSYMSPEQAQGKTEELDHTSDQYALGLILFELVSLRRAITAESPLEVVAMAAEGLKHPLTPFSRKEPIARELAAIIHKATAKSPADRYESVDAFADDLRRFLRDEEVQADPDGAMRRVKRWVGRNRGFAIMLLALMMVAAVAVAFLVHVVDGARAKEREARMQAVVALAGEQAAKMNEMLNEYESLVEGISTVASQFLSEPAPDDPAMVLYQYKGTARKPADAPPYAKQSTVYDDKVSLEHGDMSIPWEADPAALRPRALQLWRLTNVLRKTQLASFSRDAVGLPIARAEKIVLEEGVPLVWTYFASKEGVTIGMPGIWTYATDDPNLGYDPRKQPWYQIAENKRGPIWSSSGVDESGLGLLITCSEAVYDGKDDFVGVAASDLTFQHFIDHLLENEELKKADAEAFLVDEQGKVVVRSSQKDKARNASTYESLPFAEKDVLAAAKVRASGHVALDDGRLAVWSRLHAVDWLYVVIGQGDRMLAIATP